MKECPFKYKENSIKERMKRQSYINLAKEYGLIHILFNWDSIPAIIITAIICRYYLFFEGFTESVNAVTLTLIGADAGLLGIVLAGYAIMISMTQGKFLKFLKDTTVLNDIIFLFTHSSIIIGFGLIASILLSLFLPIHLLLAKILFIFSAGFTIYGVLSIILLLFNLKQYAFLRGEFSDIENDYK